MATEWKVGTKVQLASGGPIMTVTHVGTTHGTKEPYVECQWFNKNDEPQTKAFPPGALVEVPSPK
jgi:uncharacterized protein YodC (DUF2158 family)